MSKTLEGMARAIYEWQPSMDYNDVLSLKPHDSTHLHKVHYEMMAKSALWWLTNNISDEMVRAAVIAYMGEEPPESILRKMMGDFRDGLAAALKIAAEGK